MSMRTHRTQRLCLAVAVALLCAPAARAQILEPGPDTGTIRAAPRQLQRPPTAWLGLDLLVAQPVGEFADYIGTGGGAGAHILVHTDPKRISAIRFDLGWIQYASERNRYDVYPGLAVDVNTSYSILYAGVGPQLMVPSGPVRPYVMGAAGLSYFSTRSSIAGQDPYYNEDASRTNFDHTTFAWSAGGGLYIPIGRAQRFSIDVSARYHANGESEYLRKGSIQDNPDGSYTITPIHSQANLVTYQAGVAIGF